MTVALEHREEVNLISLGLQDDLIRCDGWTLHRCGSALVGLNDETGSVTLFKVFASAEDAQSAISYIRITSTPDEPEETYA